MLILGIDPGTQILGYSLLDTGASDQWSVTSDRQTLAVGHWPLAAKSQKPKAKGQKPTILAMDVLYLKRIPDFNLRIRRIFDTTLRIIDSFHPDHLAIEAPFFGKNVQSMLKLGRAQGVAIAAAMSRDISYTEYEPATIKQLVTGNGNASKEQVATMLRSILGFDDSPRYLDATDALAVAYTAHLQLSNPLNSLTQSPGQTLAADSQQPTANSQQPSNPVTHKKHKSTKKQWSEFVMQNPERVN